MKMEDVERAVCIRDRIIDLNDESRILKRQKASEDSVRIIIGERELLICSDEKDEVLDIMIKNRGSEVQELLKELKSI